MVLAFSAYMQLSNLPPTTFSVRLVETCQIPHHKCTQRTHRLLSQLSHRLPSPSVKSLIYQKCFTKIFYYYGILRTALSLPKAAIDANISKQESLQIVDYFPYV